MDIKIPRKVMEALRAHNDYDLEEANTWLWEVLNYIEFGRAPENPDAFFILAKEIIDRNE